ncbi:MAG TPA: efflux RND transporter periplasmic adaptor subunit [Gemmatimonadales bacterium]|nr:efflux RND transporter periplasmic adaptor subunit [Gemmatimonadales bacterium]
MKRAIRIAALALVLIAVAYVLLRGSPKELTLTGIVTTNDVVVSPQVAGQVTKLLVSEGDSVSQNQLLAVLSPAELQADQRYYAQSATALAAQAGAGAADLAVAEAQDSSAAADLANTKLVRDRVLSLSKEGGVALQQAESANTALAMAQARKNAADRQVAAKQQSLIAAQAQQEAARAQTTKADVRLSYAELRAPLAGLVDVRAAQLGEVVLAGQPVLTLIDPDSLWVRADVEESYIDRVRIGDALTVRLPSGATRTGTVYYRGVDAGFATQRDVSRTKRDIKTFEIRLRVPNTDRRLAVGMTAYVLLPVGRPSP